MTIGKRRRLGARSVPLWLTAGLVACGGGGGGGSSGGIGGGGEVLVDGADYRAEFDANWGLGAIKADSAYDAGGTGSGTVVAVIDTGVDVDHPELKDRLHAASTDVINGDGPHDTDGHGTMVAGFVGAERNGQLTHGVAYDTRIMAIDAYDESIEGFWDSDLAAATDHARANGADVINYSLAGGSGISVNYDAAMAAAADAGIVLVYAAGNAQDPGEDTSNPQWPARFAADPDAQGLGIIVGAVDANEAMPWWSMRAGNYKDHYLVAPGVNVTSTALGGGTTAGSGTSFAAPHVAGAVALLKQYWPALSAGEVVDIIFTTAKDLGDPGVDEVFGHGLLDLAEAVKPQGGASLPAGETADGGGEPLQATTMSLGPAFGDALRESALAQAMFLDAYGRDYRTDLTRRLVRPAPDPDMAAWLGGRAGGRQTSPGDAAGHGAGRARGGQKRACAGAARAPAAGDGRGGVGPAAGRLAGGRDGTDREGRGATAGARQPGGPALSCPGG